jgi:hypothetical protein
MNPYLPSALSSANSQVARIYGLTGSMSDFAILIPTYDASNTDAADLGLILGALLYEGQFLCPRSPGQLVKALAKDLSDGTFDGLKAGGPIPFCGGNLPAIAGTVYFQDALSGLYDMQYAGGVFGFGGPGNVLKTEGLANLASGGSIAYPTGPLLMLDQAIGVAAPKPVNSFAASTPSEVTRQGATATVLRNGKVLIAGGASPPGTSSEIYDPVHNKFAAGASMNFGRSGATATLLTNGQVLIVGGTSSPSTLTELYNPVHNSFAHPNLTPSLNSARNGATATLLPDGQVLIAGGQSVSGNCLSTVEL